MQKKLFLLDAYALIFRAYYAFIKNPRINSKGENTSAAFGFTNTLLELLNKEKPDYIAVAFDASAKTFRNDLYPEYKANRPPTPEDIKKSIPYIKQILEAFQIPTYELIGYEADDIIGTIAKKAEKEDLKVYMMTPDKDYTQLLSENILMYKPSRSGNLAEIWTISTMQEKMLLERPGQVIDLLALMGDSSDNIPGAPGVGEKTAQKLLADYDNIENLFAHVNELKGKLKEKIADHTDQILLSKKLATIALDVPVEFILEETKRKDPDPQKLKEVFEELEFNTLLQRIFKDPVKTDQKQSVVQQSLFSEDSQGNIQAESLRKTINDTPHNYVLANTAEHFNEMLHELQKADEFCFDTETTGLDIFNSKLVGISFAIKAHHGWYVPFNGNEDETKATLNKLKFALEHPSKLKIAQNIKFDMQILRNYGIHVCEPFFDTMLAHYLLNPDLRHNMNFMSSSLLNYDPVEIESLIGKKGKTQKNFKDVALEAQKEYAVEDADITFQLKKILEKQLKENQLEEVFYQLEIPLVKVLAQMEINGVKINTEALNEIAERMSREILILEKDIYELCGIEFNIASPKQLGEVLFDHLKLDSKAKKTKTKQYSTGEEILSKLVDKHPVVEKILEFRSLKKLLSTYVEALPDLIHPTSGFIHTNYNQAVTATGRLSSNHPNLQNIPIRDERGREIRAAFIPANTDRLYLAADYSQIELRLMAHLSQDKQMIEAFQSNQDIHSATAANIFKKPVNQVTKEERRKAKTANFGIIYGISAFGLAERLSISRKEAKELIDGYFESFPRVKEYMDECIKNAREKGYVSTLFGRIRKLSDINSRNAMVRGFAERNAINAPIQGSAADLIKLAMIQLHSRLMEEKLDAKLVLQVHDELVVDVHKEHVDKLRSMLVETMENIMKLSVPLVVDTGTGNNWLEAH